MTKSDDETVSFLPEERFRARVLQPFEKLRVELEAWVPGADIQHVGSTAILGSLTKGDLDVQVRVVASKYSPAKERLAGSSRSTSADLRRTPRSRSRTIVVSLTSASISRS